jgi:hypothetical protein
LQTKLTKFRFKIGDENQIRLFNYLEILAYVLALETLKKVEIRYVPVVRELPAIKVDNSQLRYLSLLVDPKTVNPDLKNLAMMHSNVTHLEIDFDLDGKNRMLSLEFCSKKCQNLLHADIPDICYFNNVTKFEVNNLNGKLLRQIQLKKLQELVIENYVEMDYSTGNKILEDLECWRVFTSKNAQLKRLEVFPHIPDCCSRDFMNLEYFKIVVNGLPLLKILEFFIKSVSDENYVEVVSLIRSKWTKFEKLELELDCPENLKTNVRNDICFPDAKFETRYGRRLINTKNKEENDDDY